MNYKISWNCEKPQPQAHFPGRHPAYAVDILPASYCSIYIQLLQSLNRSAWYKFYSSPQIRKAVRATLILFPLLGITNLLFFINPKSLARGEHEYIYMLVNTVLKSSQVLKLSVLACCLLRQLGLPCDKLKRRTNKEGRREYLPNSAIFLESLLNSLILREYFCPCCTASSTQRFKKRFSDSSGG